MPERPVDRPRRSEGRAWIVRDAAGSAVVGKGERWRWRSGGASGSSGGSHALEMPGRAEASSESGIPENDQARLGTVDRATRWARSATVDGRGGAQGRCGGDGEGWSGGTQSSRAGPARPVSGLGPWRPSVRFSVLPGRRSRSGGLSRGPERASLPSVGCVVRGRLDGTTVSV